MRALGVGLFLVIGIFFFQYRYLAPEAGINAKSADYSNHISIEQHLKEGLFFPDWDNAETGPHAVSRYLPVYHGLVGFHAIALIVESLGVPLPGAYQLILDLCLAIYMSFFFLVLAREMRKEKRWEFVLAIIAIATLFLSNFSSAVESAFFSQILSYAVLLVGWYFWTERKFKISLGFYLFASVCYPDFLIWLLPILVLSKEFKIHVAFRVGLFALWAGLLYILFVRRNLVGPESISLYPFFFLPLILVCFFRKLYNDNRFYFHALLSYTVVALGFLIATQHHFTWSYYAVKLTYPSVLFLVFTFSKIKMFDTRSGRAFVAFYVFFFWSFADLNTQAIADYFRRSDLINNQFYTEMLSTRVVLDQLRAQCDPVQTLVLPGDDDLPSGGTKLRIWAKNSLLRNLDISSVEFKAPAFKKMYSAVYFFEKEFSQAEGISGGRQRFFTNIRTLEPQFRDVCIVSPSSDRTLFKENPCFEILKEEGGQIYARCKVKTEL